MWVGQSVGCWFVQIQNDVHFCGENCFHISYTIVIQLYLHHLEDAQDTIFIPIDQGNTELCALEVCVKSGSGVNLVTLSVTLVGSKLFQLEKLLKTETDLI